MVAARIRSMAGYHWLALFGLILLAWAILLFMAVPAEMREMSRIYGAEFWASLCAVTPDTAGYLRLVLMWSLMSAAMMAPTALPALATYDDLGHAAKNTSFFNLLLGYLLVWFGFSVVAAGIQMALTQMKLVDLLGESRSPYLSAALLVAAGGYQFTSFKEACLSKCRRPLVFFMEHWNEGPLRNGVRLGLVCLGCCWALMLLAFVGGVMNLVFMGLATALMVFEKLPDIGRHLTRPLGYSLVAAGVLMLVKTTF